MIDSPLDPPQAKRRLRDVPRELVTRAIRPVPKTPEPPQPSSFDAYGGFGPARGSTPDEGDARREGARVVAELYRQQGRIK